MSRIETDNAAIEAEIIRRVGCLPALGKHAPCPECRNGKFHVQKGADGKLYGYCGWEKKGRGGEACGFTINAASVNGGGKSRLQSLLQDLMERFHEELTVQSPESRERQPRAFIEPWIYLTATRRHNPRILNDFQAIGAVPQGFSGGFSSVPEEEMLSGICRRHRQPIADYVQGLESDRAEKKGFSAKERETFEKRLERARRELETFDRECEKLKKTCVPGWLAYGAVDAHLALCSLWFEEPKRGGGRLIFQPEGGCRGLFNPTERKADESIDDPVQAAPMIIVEGVHNLLALYSVQAETAGQEAEREQRPAFAIPYTPSVAVGGSSGADIGTVAAYKREWLLWRDNDEDGRKLEDALRQKRRLRVICYSVKPKADLDDFIQAQRIRPPENPDAVHRALAEMLAQAEMRYRPLSAIEAECRKIRRIDGETRDDGVHIPNKSAHDSRQEKRDAADLLIRELKERGQFLMTAEGPYYFDRETRALSRIGLKPEATGEALNLLLNQVGINGSESIYRYVLAEMTAEAGMQKARDGLTELRLKAHWTAKTTVRDDNGTERVVWEGVTLYWYNEDGWIFRLRNNQTERVPNGTDGVFFLDEPDAAPYQYVAVGEKSSHGEIRESGKSYLETFIRRWNFDPEGPVSVEQQRLKLRCLLDDFLFGFSADEKCLICMTGEKNSGKTLLMRQIGQLFMGPEAEVRAMAKSADDFAQGFYRRSYVAVDNLDTKCRWTDGSLADLAAINATGGQWTRRALYRQDKEARVSLRGYLLFTARTPKDIRRDDVASRTLLFPLRPVPKEQRLPQETMNAWLQAHRDIILSELHDRIISVIIPAMEADAGHDIHPLFRIGGFEKRSRIIARREGNEEAVIAMLRAEDTAQKLFSGGDDPLVDIIEAFALGPKMKSEYTATELARLLPAKAQEESIPYPDKLRSAAVIGRELKKTAFKDIMRVRGIEVDERMRDGRSLYRFSVLPEHPEIQVLGTRTPVHHGIQEQTMGKVLPFTNPATPPSILEPMPF